MPLNFTLVDQNPNDITGGGGSLAGPMHDVDATGPWFVWPNQEMDSGASPFCVVAASEVRAMADALDDEVEVITGGQSAGATVVETKTGAVVGNGPVSAEYDLANPDDFARAFARE